MTFQKPPSFWWKKSGIQSYLLSPFARIYGQIVAWRMQRCSCQCLEVPVICVGNFVIGGSRKTPTVLAIAKQAIAMGLKPGILSRGYGRKMTVVSRVDLKKHNSRDVGDEPLLHAKVAMTVVAGNRLAGAQLLIKNGCNLVIMDDGFQNPGLCKDFSLVVVNAEKGVGNGFVLPAGPLRAPLSCQLPFADMLLVIGEKMDKTIHHAVDFRKPMYFASISIKNKDILKGKTVIAYAGIADPDRFFSSLSDAGTKLFDCHAFGDHHYYHDNEIQKLLDQARMENLRLVSTAKDAARLGGMGDLSEELLNNTDIVEIELKFKEPDFLKNIIAQAVERFRQRTT